jgi:hypothetical protein
MDEVACAIRLVDGILLVVDVVEGVSLTGFVSIQSHERTQYS